MHENLWSWVMDWGRGVRVDEIYIYIYIYIYLYVYIHVSLTRGLSVVGDGGLPVAIAHRE